MTIGRSWGMGYFTDLVCIGRIFSQISLELEFFSPTYNGVRFCSALYVMSDIFSVQDIFLPGIYLHAFFLLKSVCRTLFLKSPITPSKVKWSAPKLHQTFGQLTDSDLSIISEGASRACRLCYKVATRKTFWIHTSNIVCGVSRGVGPV